MSLNKIKEWVMVGLTMRSIGWLLLGAMILSFGIHNIHQRTNITEGGIIGLMLLIEHWFTISPAYITPLLDGLCYLMAWRFLGSRFIKLSLIATSFVSLFYKLWESFPPMLPDQNHLPLAAAVLGGCFVGVGVGIIIRQGGSCGGDDALALVIQHISHWKLARCYLFTDLTVLLLSLSYIPFDQILYSLVTVTVSSYLIDIVKELRVTMARS